MRLLFRWLTSYPACRVARLSIAKRRPLIFCAMCGVTSRARREFAASALDYHAASFVAAMRAAA
jgi:hypothetical protein